MLSKLNFYEKFIRDKGYESLAPRKYYDRFTSLRNSIEFEIEQILQLRKAECIDNPRKTFSYGEVKDCLKNETELKPLIVSLSQISAEISKESELSEVDIINKFDFLPEWVFPKLTASVVEDSPFTDPTTSFSIVQCPIASTNAQIQRGLSVGFVIRLSGRQD